MKSAKKSLWKVPNCWKVHKNNNSKCKFCSGNKSAKTRSWKVAQIWLRRWKVQNRMKSAKMRRWKVAHLVKKIKSAKYGEKCKIGWKVQNRMRTAKKSRWKVAQILLRRWKMQNRMKSAKREDEKWRKSYWGDEKCKIGWKVQKEKMKSGANLVEKIKSAK